MAGKKLHPGDAYLLAEEAKAIGYRIHFLKGPFERYNETCETLAQAYDIADAMNQAHGEHGRRAIIYAVLPANRAFPIKAQDRPKTP